MMSISTCGGVTHFFCQLDMRKRFRGVPGRKLPEDVPTIPPLLNKPIEELEK